MKKACFLSVLLFLSLPAFTQSTENKFSRLDYAVRIGYIHPKNFNAIVSSAFDYLVSANIGINYRAADF